MENLRNLTTAEREQLIKQGCSASCWDTIYVGDGFSAERVRTCHFEGRVEIGADVTIGGITTHIKNYRIEDGATIVGVGRLECEGLSSFGEGVMVATINEAGGREVPLYRGLTAQLAYILALYRHRKEAIAAILGMIESDIATRKSEMGTIGKGAKVLNCNIIKNTNIGPAATLDGVSLLSNGTIVSTEQSPSVVGINVRMTDFVTADGCHIDNGCALNRCYIGQGVQLGNFTATDSLFFANSHCENGEACSIFAGPYTVSHHKATLLIAGMFSFFNAGSGSNQSNHLFKTGPVHQGIHQRGCKFASDAYMMLPVKNGAFTVILGRHKTHPDTENFPYSYLIESQDSSLLIPAHNLVSYGTVRDIGKWPKRDKRKGEKSDIINFEECNPFIAERLLKGLNTLKELGAKEISEYYNYGRMRIKASMLRRGVKLYTLARSKFIGDMLKAERTGAEVDGSGHWIDVAGEYMPTSAMERLLADIENGTLATTKAIMARFAVEHSLYADYTYSWAIDRLSAFLGHTPTEEEISRMIELSGEAARDLKTMAEKDREKDMDNVMRISYGIDSLAEEDIVADFNAVRFPNN